MSFSLALQTAPAFAAISTADAKAWLKVDTSDDDTLIDALVAAAVAACEAETARVLCASTWVLRLDGFPCGGAALVLPVAPVSSISSVKYYDADNVLQTWSSTAWEADLNSLPPRLRPVLNAPWPGTRDRFGAVEITLVAGYASAAAIPPSLLQAVRFILSHLHENRMAVLVGVGAQELPLGAQMLLSGWRLPWLG